VKLKPVSSASQQQKSLLQNDYEYYFYFLFKVWATSALNPEIGAVPFLPTNPHLSATRNQVKYIIQFSFSVKKKQFFFCLQQGRQKLARFSQIEFQGLLTDCLIDARRRQNMANLRPIDGPLPYNILQLKQQRESNLSDDEPL
jgi:G protein-coupled receptor kinase interactor 2